jgi:hypothetical protein
MLQIRLLEHGDFMDHPEANCFKSDDVMNATTLGPVQGQFAVATEKKI